MKHEFNIGQQVYHKFYGKGKVTRINLNGQGEACYEVSFPRYGKVITVMNEKDMIPYNDDDEKIVNGLIANMIGSEYHGVKPMNDWTDEELDWAHDKMTEMAESKSTTKAKICKGDDCPDAKECNIHNLKLSYEGEPCPSDLAQKQMEAHKATEAVNHPSHYNTGKIEVIDYIESLGLGTGFNLGNAIKYLSRAGLKPGNEKEQDINKALWYIKRQKEAWSKSWQGQKVFSPSKINCLDYIEDKELMSYCTAGAIDHIDASLAADTKNEAVWHLTKAENSLLYEVDHYYGKKGDE